MLRVEVEEGKAEVGAGVVAPTGPALIVEPHTTRRTRSWMENGEYKTAVVTTSVASTTTRSRILRVSALSNGRKTINA
jgi:hypothetical protein